MKAAAICIRWVHLAAWLSVAAYCAGGCVVVDNRNPPNEPPPDVMFELVNTTDFVLDANFFVSATATSQTDLFVRENIYTDYSTSALRTLASRATASFSLPCDATAAIGVRKPVFSNPVTFSGGESLDQILQVKARDFVCGQGLRFVYYTDGDQFRVRLERF